MKKLTFAIAGIVFATISWACCSVGIGMNSVFFAGQRNIIVWDPATKTEHFIRQAVFETEGASLGFIAPTPSIPKLEEVDSAAFKTLDDTEPKSSIGIGCSAKSEMAAASAPEIVQEVDIAGYHVVTLKATDALGLAKWMKQYGYSTSKPIEAWTEFYIRKNWYLTCFKVNSSPSGPASTGLVKMSFTTEKPFNPYLVPVDNFPEHERESVLGLYFVGPGVYAPEKGGTKQSLIKKWVALLTDDTISKLKTQLKLSSIPESATLTAFEDWSFPNIEATDDVYFYKSAESTIFYNSPRILQILGGLVLVGAIVWFVMRSWQNKPAKI
jgi:hypothetical protein